eukprot:COSAG02_NODE_755_length_17556_cov_43.170361_2_plen_101_part_00
MSMVQDVRVVRKFQRGKLEGGGGRDFSQAKSDKAVIEYESQSIGLTKVSPGNVREYLPVFVTHGRSLRGVPSMIDCRYCGLYWLSIDDCCIATASDLPVH